MRSRRAWAARPRLLARSMRKRGAVKRRRGPESGVRMQCGRALICRIRCLRRRRTSRGITLPTRCRVLALRCRYTYKRHWKEQGWRSHWCELLTLRLLGKGGCACRIHPGRLASADRKLVGKDRNGKRTDPMAIPAEVTSGRWGLSKRRCDKCAARLLLWIRLLLVNWRRCASSTASRTLFLSRALAWHMGLRYGFFQSLAKQIGVCKKAPLEQTPGRFNRAARIAARSNLLRERIQLRESPSP